MFNRGVGHVQTDLKKDGNLPAEFNINFITALKVEVYVASSNATDNGGNVGGDVPSLSQALSLVLSPDEEKDVSIDAKDATSSSMVATLDEKVASLEPKDEKVEKKA